MHHFDYRDGVMHAEGVDLRRIADAVGTPFYCYSTATIERHYTVFSQAFGGTDRLVCYALKANSNQAVLKTLARLGAGMDVVSEGELRRARAAGVPGSRSPSPVLPRPPPRWRMRSTRTSSASTSSLRRSSRSCPPWPRPGDGPPASRSASTPTSTPKTHHKISTGKSENKFGIPISQARAVYARAATLPGIKVTGVDMHIGSQITDLQPFDDAFALLSEFVRDLRSDGHAIDHVDLGGGLGIPYREGVEPPPHPERYAEIVKRNTHNLGCTLVFEPGRLIVGNAGILVTRVVYVKDGEGKTFVIVDAGMNDLIRPTLYEAHHDIKPVMEAPAGAPRLVADVVGPVCETGDYLALDRAMARPKAGDLLAVMTAGAYGAAQAGTYNSRLLVAEVMVNGDQFAVVRPRQTYEELIGLDRIPGWLG